MDKSRKLIIGYDLCEDYSQMRYSYKTFEPITINPIEDEKIHSFQLFFEVSESRTWYMVRRFGLCQEGLRSIN